MNKRKFLSLILLMIFLPACEKQETIMPQKETIIDGRSIDNYQILIYEKSMKDSSKTYRMEIEFCDTLSNQSVQVEMDGLGIVNAEVCDWNQDGKNDLWIECSYGKKASTIKNIYVYRTEDELNTINLPTGIITCDEEKQLLYVLVDSDNDEEDTVKYEQYIMTENECRYSKALTISQNNKITVYTVQDIRTGENGIKYINCLPDKEAAEWAKILIQ